MLANPPTLDSPASRQDKKKAKSQLQAFGLALDGPTDTQHQGGFAIISGKKYVVETDQPAVEPAEPAKYSEEEINAFNTELDKTVAQLRLPSVD